MKIRMWFLVSALLSVLVCGAAAETGQGQAKSGEIERITVDELILMVAKKRPVTIIDVRNTDSYEHKIVGALQIPHDEVKARLKEIPRNREIVTYCA